MLTKQLNILINWSRKDHDLEGHVSLEFAPHEFLLIYMQGMSGEPARRTTVRRHQPVEPVSDETGALSALHRGNHETTTADSWTVAMCGGNSTRMCFTKLELPI
jgi:hypothetical protein